MKPTGSRRAGVATVLLLCLGMSMDAWADEIFLVISGGQLGPVPGEVAIKGLEGKIKAVGYKWQVSTPLEPTTQQAIGQRRHEPLRISREPGRASPRLFAAWVSNELLPTVMVEFWVLRKSTGSMTVYQTVKLTNARVVSMTRSAEPSPELAAGQVKTIETIELAYQGIEIRDLESNLAATDSAFGQQF